MPKRLGKFELPNKLTKVEEGSTSTYGKFIAEPFEAGYGHTIGNSLRRVLLSSIEGAAISSIKIEGVNHEFQSIDGVVEDVTDIVLNLKKILIVSTKREPISLSIKVNRPPVTAADIQADANITIVNPDQVICTLDKSRTFEAEIEIKTGRGYCPGELNKKEDQAIGVIPIDSLFSPVKLVKYAVEPRASARSPTTTSSSSRSGPMAASPPMMRSSSRPRSSSITSTSSIASATKPMSSKASRARSARSRTSCANSSICRSTRLSSPFAPPTASTTPISPRWVSWR